MSTHRRLYFIKYEHGKLKNKPKYLKASSSLPSPSFPKNPNRFMYKSFLSPKQIKYTKKGKKVK